MLGLLALTEVLPLVVLPIVGGAIADAVERRRFLMVAQGAIAMLSVALAANAFLPDPQVWVLFVFSFLSASAYSLYSPAFRAWPARSSRRTCSRPRWPSRSCTTSRLRSRDRCWPAC